jgi:hypothetical protein
LSKRACRSDSTVDGEEDAEPDTSVTSSTDWVQNIEPVNVEDSPTLEIATPVYPTRFRHSPSNAATAARDIGGGGSSSGGCRKAAAPAVLEEADAEEMGLSEAEDDTEGRPIIFGSLYASSIAQVVAPAATPQQFKSVVLLKESEEFPSTSSMELPVDVPLGTGSYLSTVVSGRRSLVVGVF